MCRGCPGRVMGAADGPCQGRDHPGQGQRAHQERSEGSVAGSTSGSARGAELSSQRTKAIWARLQEAPRSLIVRPEPSSAKARISMRVQGFGSGPARPGPHPRHVAHRRVRAGRCCPDAGFIGASARGPRPASCPMGWAIRREIHQDQRRSAPWRPPRVVSRVTSEFNKAGLGWRPTDRAECFARGRERGARFLAAAELAAVALIIIGCSHRRLPIRCREQTTSACPGSASFTCTLFVRIRTPRRSGTACRGRRCPSRVPGCCSSSGSVVAIRSGCPT